jgi:pimeloyl-ACP methyl ester carboxylesterase
MAWRKRASAKRRLFRIATVAGVLAFAAAYRFALRYRARAGFPSRSPVEGSPADFGLTFERVEIPSGNLALAGWFVPAEGSGSAEGSSAADSAGQAAQQRPGVVVVHGWESNRGRTFAHVRYLHAAGFHCLVIDVRGHGDSPSDDLPINVPEFADDTISAVRWLAARREVGRVGVIGHSMGAAGAIVAASREPLVEAVVSLSSPADLVRMTRGTFDMAEMHVPEPVATPLAWFTAAMLLAPRRHGIHEASASVAAARYHGPLLLIHGAQDHGVPVEHLDLIARAAEETRTGDDPEVETMVLMEFGHRWLYEDEGCRRLTASFFARSLGNLDPETAGRLAAETEVRRPDEPVYGFSALEGKEVANR